MKVIIPILLNALLSLSSTEAKDMIRGNTRAEEGSGEPEVADIINGTPTGKALPYQVGLSRDPKSKPSCGGSLIAPRVVLTAAHCYMDDFGELKEPVLRTVQVNMYDASNIYEPGLIMMNLSSGKIGQDIFPHPNYNPTKPFPATHEYDIALVILPFAVEGDNIKYAKLNKDRNVPVDDERLYISGWGDTEDGSQSDILLGTVVNYVPDDECAARYDVQGSLFGMMCAYEEGTGVCFGDSGGPLVIAAQDEAAPANEPPLQVGIVSWGRDCATPGYPQVYTRVSHYFDWITSTACEAVGELCPSAKSGTSSKALKSKASKSKASKSQRPSSMSA
jgi:trypsin